MSERRVATSAAAGRTNREIAQALCVTTTTVEVQLSNAYRQLGIQAARSSRARSPGGVTPDAGHELV